MSDPPWEDLKREWEDPSKETMAGILAKLVGAVVIYHAMVEHWVDGIVFCVHDRVEGAKKIRKVHPYNARDEMQFLTECLIMLPPLEPFKDKGLALLTSWEESSEFRHNVAHGHIGKIDWDKGVIEFSRKFKGENHEPVRRSLTIRAEDLYKEGAKIKELILPFNDFTQDLLKAFDPTYLRK